MIFSFTTTANFAQENFSYRVVHYTTENGLSHNSGNCFTQDEYGFIWIGSHSGLEKFDGYNFTIYQHSQEDTASLSNSKIGAVYLDDANTLWIGTQGGGLNKYIRDENRFETFFSAKSDNPLLNSSNISFIAPATPGKMWLGALGGGLNLVDVATQESVPFSTQSGLSQKLRNNEVNCYTYDDQGNLWIGTMDGINVVDTATLVSRDYYQKEGDLDFFKNRVVRALSNDGRGNVWVGVWVTGVYAYQLAEQKTAFVEGIAEKPEVYDIIPITNDRMAIATNKGLFLVGSPEEPPVALLHEPDNPHSLSSNYCTSLFLDRSGVLWIGTINSGLNKIDLYQKPFELFKKKPGNATGLSDNTIYCFEEDWLGNVWIGTQQGLNLLQPGVGIKKTYHFRDSYNDDKINAIATGKYPTLWVGTDYGLVKFNTHTGEHIRYEMDQARSNSLTNNVVNVLHYGHDSDYLWVGTWGGGLDRLDIATNKWKNFPADTAVFSHNVVLDIAEDANGHLWLGTHGRGLVRFDPREERMYYLDEQSDRQNGLVALSVMIDSGGKIWMGTGANGIRIYDPASQHTLSISRSNGSYLPGLLSNEIAAILESKPGEYWFSSAMGITKALVVFEKDENNRPAIAAQNFFHFDYRDGLQANAFNQRAALKSASGKLFFGGNRGFNAFFPDSIAPNPFLAKPVITGMELMNNRVIPGRKYRNRILLEKPIYETSDITLEYNENLVTFEFSALHYASPSKNKFAYKLENFHEQWIHTDAQRRFVSFSYLKPGRYTLKLKASNSDGVWNDQPYELSILVLPPWWQSPWFIIVANVSLLGLIFGYIRYRVYTLKKEQRVLEDIITKRTHEILEQKNDIQAQNEELASMNEEVSAQSEQLAASHKQLEKAHEDLKKAQKQLKHINQNLDSTVKARTVELEKTIKELDQFVYVASHDLGAPLKSMLGLVHITRLEHKDDSLRKKLDLFESSISRLEKVIFSLKQFSVNSNQQVAKAEVKILALIEEIIDSMRFLSHFPRLSFSINVPRELTLATDASRLKSILTNLIDNAIKYHDYDKPQPAISITASCKWNRCFIIIEDNGLGIENSQIDKIFNMFYRASTQSEGSGLGLYIVKESVQKLGGSIKVNSKPQKGTRFILVV